MPTRKAGRGKAARRRDLPKGAGWAEHGGGGEAAFPSADQWTFAFYLWARLAEKGAILHPSPDAEQITSRRNSGSDSRFLGKASAGGMRWPGPAEGGAAVGRGMPDGPSALVCMRAFHSRRLFCMSQNGAGRKKVQKTGRFVTQRHRNLCYNCSVKRTYIRTEGNTAGRRAVRRRFFFAGKGEKAWANLPDGPRPRAWRC